MRFALLLLTAASLLCACGRDALDTQPAARCDAGVSVCGWNASTKTWDLDCHLACPASACASGRLVATPCSFDNDAGQYRGCQSYYCREDDGGVAGSCTAAATTYYSNDPRCPDASAGR